MGDEIDFDFEQDISRQEEERRRLLESQGLLVDSNGGASVAGRTRSLVCRHWLRGMCWKGDFCEFLHQYDTTRLPVCRQFQKTGFCADQERGSCVFLHEKTDDAPICIHYFLGFCGAGPRCRKKHQRLDVSQLLPLVPDWYLHLILANAWAVVPQTMDAETESVMAEVEAICRRELASSSAVPLPGRSPSRPVRGPSVNATAEEERKGRRNVVDDELFRKAQEQGILGLNIPKGVSVKIRVFMIKSSDVKNILKSIRLGVWATGKQNARVLEQAFSESDHVVLLFSANESGGFQGYGRMMTNTIPGLYSSLWGAFSVRLGGNFRVRWLKQCKTQFERFGGLTNPLNDDQPIRKSRDCQEVPLSLAQVICAILDTEKEEDLLAGTEEASLPRIDHATFFSLPEAGRVQLEIQMGLRGTSDVDISEASNNGGSASQASMELHALLDTPAMSDSVLHASRAHPYATAGAALGRQTRRGGGASRYGPI